MGEGYRTEHGLGVWPMIRVQNGSVAATHSDLRERLGELLSGAGPTRPVRAEIAESWRRVASGGLQPDRFDPMYDPDVEQDSRLERAAAPVLNQFINDLAGTETSLVLTDERGQVIDRRVSDPHFVARLDDILLAPGFFYDEAKVGTNGIGSALAQGRPAVVHGGEHFADRLTGMACAGTPVTDPRNGQVLGIIDITVRAEDANPLLLAFVKRGAWEIEQRLFDDASTIERVLHERFVHARRAKRPVVLVSEYMVMASTAASRVLEASDRSLLWEWARRTIAGGGRSQDVMLSKGTVVTGCEPVHDGGALVGALVWLRAAASADGGGRTRNSSGRAALGWGSLTQSERGVADLIADGLTNRQVGARLFLSPYTVDAHLRHIFNKLDIGSRVELARMVAEHRGAHERAGRERPA
jgi:DNA-binding CsgD family transcriptional regulator